MARGKTLPFAFRCQGKVQGTGSDSGKSSSQGSTGGQQDGCNKIVMTRDLNRAGQQGIAKEGVKKFCGTCRTNVIVKGKQHKHS